MRPCTVGRTMGTLVEVHHDENGIIWPKSVTPYHVHLISLGTDKAILDKAEKLLDREKKRKKE